MRTPNIRRGFTLVELLVVIAIIALLISILLPSLRNSREIAKTLICATNWRSLKVANEYYADESKEWYVPINGGRPLGAWLGNRLYGRMMGLNGPIGWRLQDYRCPSTPPNPLPLGPGQTGGGRNVFAWNWSNVYTNYGPTIPRRTRVVGRQSEIIQGSDCTDWHMHRNYSRFSTWQNHREMRLWMVAYRHINDQANVVFFDGHIEALGPDDIAIDRVPQDQFHRMWNVYEKLETEVPPGL